MSASLARLLALGIVRKQGRTYGYKAYRELRIWHVEAWTSVKPGSVYHALNQLTKQQLLREVSVEASKEGPSRTLYEMTAAGEAEFRSLLSEALSSVDMEFLGIGLAYMQALPRAEVIGLLQQRLVTLNELFEGLQATCTLYKQTDELAHLRDVLGIQLTSYGAAIAWTQDLCQRLEAGAYTFADEGATSA